MALSASPSATPLQLLSQSMTTPNPSLSYLSSLALPSPLFFRLRHRRRSIFAVNAVTGAQGGEKKKQIRAAEEKVEEVEVEEELPWIQEKALDLVEFTGSVTQAIPGPRVGGSKLPWLLTLPIAYFGISFVIAFVRTVQKFNSPKGKRRQLVNKNALLCKSIDDLLQKGRNELQSSAMKDLVQKTGFSIEDVLRKYIRYSLNEKPFNPDMVADLIQLRKASTLSDSEVAEILNEVSRRIVKDKGPVVMDASGYSEKGFKRKLAVQALFGKIFYLSESQLEEGLFSEDAEKLRLHTLSEAGDVDMLEKMARESYQEDTVKMQRSYGRLHSYARTLAVRAKMDASCMWIGMVEKMAAWES
ncbi:hypothetical protein V2J09_004067 [Rumex salicifolius]